MIIKIYSFDFFNKKITYNEVKKKKRKGTAYDETQKRKIRHNSLVVDLEI